MALIGKMRLRGDIQTKIARRFSLATVNRVCRALGMGLRSRYMKAGEAVETPDTRTQQIIQARREGETLEAIGAPFGITRERVRQILKKHAPGLDAELAAKKAAALRPVTFPLPGFKAAILSWVRESGALRCSICGAVEYLGKRWAGTQHCRTCNTRRAWARRYGKTMAEYNPKPIGSWMVKPEVQAAVDAGLIWCGPCQLGLEKEKFSPGLRDRRTSICRECSSRMYRERMKVNRGSGE